MEISPYYQAKVAVRRIDIPSKRVQDLFMYPGRVPMHLNLFHLRIKVAYEFRPIIETKRSSAAYTGGYSSKVYTKLIEKW